MRARLIITLALCWWSCPERVFADDFDDDFGSLPAPTPPPAPVSPPAVAPVEVGRTADVPDETPYPPLDESPRLRTTQQERDARYKLRTFVHPTVDGLVGGVHVIDASSGHPGTFRVALNSGFFRKNGFIERGDHHRSASGNVSLSLTPIEHLELAAQLNTSVTRNRTLDPEVVQVVGDAHLFAKGYLGVLPWLTVAGDGELALLNGIGQIGAQGGATSVGLRASASADLRALEHNPLPIIVRSNLRYLFDNSGRLGRDIERDRLRSLASSAPAADEYRQLLTPAERNALQINRVDRIGGSVGVELPLAPRERLNVSPMLEWTFALPVNRQGFDCVATRIPGQRDSCLAKTGFGARPSTLTMGLRVQPYVNGLGLLAAVDLATSGSRTFVRELAPQERYVVRIGVSYAYDPRKAPAQRPRIVRVEIPAASVRGHVLGQVVDSQTRAPVARAVVHFEATTLSDLLTDTNGAFKSAELAPGAYGMRVSAEGYREALCVAHMGAREEPRAVAPDVTSAVAGSTPDVAVRCELVASAYYGALAGRVTDTSGRPVAGAYLALTGANDLSLTSAKDGTFRSDKLLEGTYDLTATAPGYFTRSLELKVLRAAESTPSLVLLARPAQPLVHLTRQRIALARAIEFVGESAIIADASQSMLGEVAELLLKHPQLTQIEIAAHLDDAGLAAAALTLTEQRAQAVRDWLIQAGVSGDRLTAKGYGSARPAVPNITAKNRARNRRVELLIK